MDDDEDDNDGASPAQAALFADVADEEGQAAAAEQAPARTPAGAMTAEVAARLRQLLHGPRLKGLRGYRAYYNMPRCKPLGDPVRWKLNEFHVMVERNGRDNPIEYFDQAMEWGIAAHDMEHDDGHDPDKQRCEFVDDRASDGEGEDAATGEEEEAEEVAEEVAEEDEEEEEEEVQVQQAEEEEQRAAAASGAISEKYFFEIDLNFHPKKIEIRKNKKKTKTTQ